MTSNQPDPSHTGYTHFKNKRLCERWLDNLFMVLYEDLRIYTIWRTEMAQSRQQAIDYKKTATEWEILGELAERLHHFDEAVEAYRNCLAIRFSPKAMKGILKMYERQGDTRGMLSALIRLIAWQYRWYSEVRSPDSSGIKKKARLTMNAVLPRTPVHDPQAHRGRGRRQGAQHRAGDQPAAAGARPDAPLLPAVRDLPE